jgi:excinuclease UvrABC nuclease subunit
VKLRDDKQFLVLRLDPKAKWPRLELVRRMRKDGAQYFGPYHSANSARHTLRVVNRHFKLRTCTDYTLSHRSRPCLQYQIGRCPAPCVLTVDVEEYQAAGQARRAVPRGAPQGPGPRAARRDGGGGDGAGLRDGGAACATS